MNVVVTSIDYILNWSRANSLWPLTFATSCCGIEMMQTVASHNDIARFGSEIFRGSPRQADLLICAGTITHKMAPALLRLYEQMPEPKYVIAMGACTCGGGMFNETSSPHLSPHHFIQQGLIAVNHIINNIALADSLEMFSGTVNL